MRSVVRSPRSISPVASRIARSACLLGLLLPVAACDTISGMNPFQKDDTYKPEIVAQVPADKLYNDGLALLEKREFDAPPRSSPIWTSSIPSRPGRRRRC